MKIERNETSEEVVNDTSEIINKERAIVTSKDIILSIITTLNNTNVKDKITLQELDLIKEEGSTKVIGKRVVINYETPEIDIEFTKLGFKTNSTAYIKDYLWHDDISKQLNKAYWYETLYDGLLIEMLNTSILGIRFNKLLSLQLHSINNKVTQLKDKTNNGEQEGTTSKD